MKLQLNYLKSSTALCISEVVEVVRVWVMKDRIEFNTTTKDFRVIEIKEIKSAYLDDKRIYPSTVPEDVYEVGLRRLLDQERMDEGR